METSNGDISISATVPLKNIWVAKNWENFVLKSYFNESIPIVPCGTWAITMHQVQSKNIPNHTEAAQPICTLKFPSLWLADSQRDGKEEIKTKLQPLPHQCDTIWSQWMEQWGMVRLHSDALPYFTCTLNNVPNASYIPQQLDPKASCCPKNISAMGPAAGEASAIALW